VKKQLSIIGAGPAGLAAALYASRARIETLLIEKLSPGGQVLVTDWIENYLGFPDGISGYDLIEKMASHARKFGVAEKNGEVESVSRDDESGIITLELAGGERIESKAVIIATGARPNRLNVPGEDELTGKGVSYCATCDGPFFRDQVVAVVGGGDSAVQEALFLTRFAKKVFLIHRRDQLRAIKVLQEKALSHPKIEIIWDTVVESINGNNTVKSLTLSNRKSGAKGELSVEGVFIFVGIHPNTDFVRGFVSMDDRGFIITDEWMKTSVLGVYAVGDCRAKPLRQIITATGEGATAAYGVEHYLAAY